MRGGCPGPASPDVRSGLSGQPWERSFARRVLTTGATATPSCLPLLPPGLALHLPDAASAVPVANPALLATGGYPEQPMRIVPSGNPQ